VAATLLFFMQLGIASKFHSVPNIACKLRSEILKALWSTLQSFKYFS